MVHTANTVYCAVWSIRVLLTRGGGGGLLCVQRCKAATDTSQYIIIKDSKGERKDLCTTVCVCVCVYTQYYLYLYVSALHPMILSTTLHRLPDHGPCPKPLHQKSFGQDEMSHLPFVSSLHMRWPSVDNLFIFL